MNRDDFGVPAVLQPYDQEAHINMVADTEGFRRALDKTPRQSPPVGMVRPRLNVARAAAYALAIIATLTGAAMLANAQSVEDAYVCALVVVAGVELIAVACGLLTVLYEGGKP